MLKTMNFIQYTSNSTYNSGALLSAEALAAPGELPESLGTRVSALLLEEVIF